uniref:Ig-like domain-containing protein n=1 Tax=Sinocyclocheilus rhinocerous TaxID=307959 RepID=A0A673JAK2_9TELE
MCYSLFLEPPKFVMKLDSTKLALNGSLATLECKVTGSPEISIRWYKNETEISSNDKYQMTFIDSTVAYLEIKSFESADVADYQCCISNDVGRITSKAVAKLKDPPLFVKKVENTTAVLGSAVKLQGTLKGSAPLTVQWFKDSEIVRDDDPNITTTFENNIAILAIANVAINHGGKYTCQAENEAGKQKCEATVSVQEPARFVEKPPSISVTAGDSATLECKVSGSPDLKVKWFRDGKEITGSRKCKISFKDNVAALKILSPSQSAKYTCQVSNDAGKVSCTAALFVKEPPKFVMKLDSTKLALNGSLATLECKVTGSPEISIRWYKNETEISSNDKYQMTFIDSVAKLQISNCCVEDSGDYICQASSEAGSDRCSCLVTVKEPPSFVQKMDNTNVLLGGEVSLQCVLKGSLPMTVSWMKDDHEIKESEHVLISFENQTAVVYISSVQLKHGGKYTCHAQNEAGSQKCTAVLAVKGV